MGLYFHVFIFLIGLAVGSFFNVIIFRFNTGRGVIKGRSKCGNCLSVVKWFDLIPILGFFMLKGRCRKCKGKISPLYPIVEISTATTLLLLLLKTTVVSYLTVLNIFIVLLFVLIVFIDARYFVIPDKILVILLAAVIGLKIVGDNTHPLYLLISSLGLTSFFVILFLVSRGRWIGLGDIKLIFVICLLLEYPLSYIALVLSVWAASLFSLTLLATKRATLKTEIPFGAFLSVTTVIFVVFNHGIQEISKYFYQ